jgi:hypothetical protein
LVEILEQLPRIPPRIIPIFSYGRKEQLGRTSFPGDRELPVEPGSLIRLAGVWYFWNGDDLTEWYPPGLNRAERRAYDARARANGKLASRVN